jgi:hypothetical protein
MSEHPFQVPTAEDHRASALVHIARADQPGLAPEGAIAHATVAVAYALLASAPVDLEPAEVRGTAPINAAGVLALTILCAAVVAVVWLLTR